MALPVDHRPAFQPEEHVEVEQQHEQDQTSCIQMIAKAILFGSLVTAVAVSFIFENLAPALLGAAGAVGALAVLIFSHCYTPEVSAV